MILSCPCVQASRRWCLSGTPIQNSIDDLYSYFRFLRYSPYNRQQAFKALLKEPLVKEPNIGAARLQACLKVRFVPGGVPSRASRSVTTVYLPFMVSAMHRGGLSVASTCACRL